MQVDGYSVVYLVPTGTMAKGLFRYSSEGSQSFTRNPISEPLTSNPRRTIRQVKAKRPFIDILLETTTSALYHVFQLSGFSNTKQENDWKMSFLTKQKRNSYHQIFKCIAKWFAKLNCTIVVQMSFCSV